MTATETIEKLKAERRAEIARAKRLASEEAARVADENARRLEAVIVEALGRDYPALHQCPFTVRDAGRWERALLIRHVEFDFPGCTVVTLRLAASERADGRLHWKQAGEATGGEYETWAVEGRDGRFETLADALIAADTGEAIGK